MTMKRDVGEAREVARAVARAGWPVIPIRVDVDDKAPSVRWKHDPVEVCRTEADVTDKWSSTWPRWAAICGVPRSSDGKALINLDADSSRAPTWPPVCSPTTPECAPGAQEALTPGPRCHCSSTPSRAGTRCCAGSTSPRSWTGEAVTASRCCPAACGLRLATPRCVMGTFQGPRSPRLDVPADLAAVVLKYARLAAAAHKERTARTTPSRFGEPDLSDGGAFEKFLAAVAASGRIVNRLRGRAGEAYVQCPGRRHPNQNRNRPALHVTARGGGIGLFCFARGCSVAEIVTAFGLELADLYDPLDIEFEFIDSQDEQG
jgi:hypothetical protein